ncbi:MAG: hypothetical protein D6785_07900 [Planctomycetota bacterium]|nr:MAG: hypothetical protein D6785_07900 [Planctomycetota bacterium]
MMDPEFLKSLKETFRREGEEILERLSQSIIKVEKEEASRQGDLLESIYRDVHSLKGAARAVGMREVEDLAHSLESLLKLWKEGKLEISSKLFDLFHQVLEDFDFMIHHEPSLPEGWMERRKELDDIVDKACSENIQKKEEPSTAKAVFLEERHEEIKEEPPKEAKEERKKETEKEHPISHEPQKEKSRKTLRKSRLSLGAEKIDLLFHRAQEFIPLPAVFETTLQRIQEIHFSLEK